jgi:hypothetical protein
LLCDSLFQEEDITETTERYDLTASSMLEEDAILLLGSMLWRPAIDGDDGAPCREVQSLVDGLGGPQC